MERKKKLAKTKRAASKKNNKSRMRKPKRPVKIEGLDLLHNRTLFSTSDQAIGMRLPPAAGCIDEHLTSFAGTMIHEELDVSSMPTETPYAIKILLDIYRAQFLNFIESMKSSSFKENVHRQIEAEREKNKRLLNRTGQLEKQIKVLVEDSVLLLKARMQELGINTTSQNDLLCKAKEIVGKHKELQIMASKIQNQVTNLEEEHNAILAVHINKLSKNHTEKSIDFELASKESHKLVLKEIENTLSQRKNLKNKIFSLEAEVSMIEKANEEKRQTVEIPKEQEHPTKNVQITCVSGNNLKSGTFTTSKTSRRNREHRSKTHDWPEIPEISKIEEKNPEILAQKILETGRQIEAGKLLANPQGKTAKMDVSYQKRASNMINSYPKCENMQFQPKTDKSVLQSNLNSAQSSSAAGKKSLDSHKVVNFEDRLKSIITSALQCQDFSHPNSAPQTLVLPNSQQQKQLLMVQQTSVSPKKGSNCQVTKHSDGNWNLPENSPQKILTIAGVPTHFNSANNSNMQQTLCNPVNHRQVLTHRQSAPNLSSEHKRHYQSLQQETTYTQIKRNEHLPNFAKVMNVMNQGEAHKIYPRNMQQIQMMQQQTQFLQAQREREVSMILQQRQLLEENREFKTPDNVRYERQDMGRSSVGSIENEYQNSGNTSSIKCQMPRSISSLSQPDYTQVSPAKLALRRHLSQEKLSQNSTAGSQLMTKTIGEFINSEIEKTLEITPQSIINAVIQHNIPTGNRNNSPLSCTANQDENFHYATSNAMSTTTKPQLQSSTHDKYIDDRQIPLPLTSKSISPTMAVKSSSQAAINHVKTMNFASGSKSPDRNAANSYKIDTKIFTSNIGMSMRKDEEKMAEHEPPLEGLAASLRQHVIASMKIKEETETSDLKYSYPQIPFSSRMIKKECKLNFIIGFETFY